MAKKRTSNRARRAPSGRLPLRRVGFLFAVACWAFLAIALVGFDAADWPSHTVSAHNDPTVNYAGPIGAALAYWTLTGLGAGVWVLLLFTAAGLIAFGRNGTLSHPILRICGAALVAASVATLDVAWFGGFSGTPAVPGGLTGDFFASELLERFNQVGVALWMLTAIAIGAVVAADDGLAIVRSKFYVPATVRAFFAAAHPAAIGQRLRRFQLGGLRLATAGGPGFAPHTDLEDEEYEEEDEDEDEYEYVDEDEEEEEEDDEYEYVDEDEDEEEDDEYEYEDEEEEEEEEEEETSRPALTRKELKEKIAKLPVRMASSPTHAARDEDILRDDNFEGYQFPSLDLLDDPESNYSAAMEEHVREQAGILEETLQTFDIDAEVAGIESGPVVTLYSVQLAPGTRVARINAIASDLARSLQAPNVRIIPTMSGKTTVGIEVPNPQKEKVRLKELMSGGHASGMMLPMFLGKNNSGEALVADLASMPHMLIAGTTGSGKSVCMNSIIMSWLYTKRPDELKLVLVDPKMVEMSQFSDVPHLMCPVVTDMIKAAAILEWAVEKMEERYQLLQSVNVRDMHSYNELEEEDRYERAGAESDLERAKLPNRMPYLVFVIDELADLMMTTKEVEHSIVRIAQKARSVGIHLILATQRPQANVVTGLIKSNMPCRVSFKVASGMDSRIVLDKKGAELLLGQGDMMYLSPSASDIARCQGTLVTDRETRAVAKFLKTVAAPNFERSLIAIRTGGARAGGDGGSTDKRDALFDEAVELFIESGRGSVTLLQRRFSIGYGRASRLVDQMSLAGIVGEHRGSRERKVLLSIEDWHQMRAIESGEVESNDYNESDADDGFVCKPEEPALEAVPDEFSDEFRD